MNSRDKLIEIARREVGFREGPGNRNKYGPNGAWCGMFVNWCAHAAGVKIPDCAWTPAGVAGFKRAGQWTTGAKGIKAGDIVFFQFDSDPGPEHVGIVVGPGQNGRVETIEGNTNNDGGAEGHSVLRKSRRPETILGYGRPDFGLLTLARHSVYPGAKGPKVRAVQKALVEVGIKVPLSERTVGRFGKGTQQAYSLWQWRLGWRGKDADGVPGESSLRALATRTGLFDVA